MGVELAAVGDELGARRALQAGQVLAAAARNEPAEVLAGRILDRVAAAAVVIVVATKSSAPRGQPERTAATGEEGGGGGPGGGASLTLKKSAGARGWDRFGRTECLAMVK